MMISAPVSPILRGRLPFLLSPATPLPWLTCPLPYFNSRHKTLHFGENFMEIGPKLKVTNVKSQFYGYVMVQNGIQAALESA